MSIEELQERLSLIEGGKVLDVATGRGEFIHAICEFKSRESITAIDISVKAGAALRAGFPDIPIDFIAMDADFPAFRGGVFDTVCISSSLHHFKNPSATLSGLLETLKTGGYLIVNEMRCDGLTETQTTHDLLHRWWARVHTLAGVTHNPTYGADEIRAIISTLNLAEVVTIEYAWPIEDPFEESLLNTIEKSCHDFISKITSENYPRELVIEGEVLIERLRKTGYAPAAALFAIGKKSVK